MVERIAGFLADNALTQSWAQTMDRHVITPIELQFVKEMPPEERFNAFATRMIGSDGRINDQGRQFIAAARTGKNDPPGRLEQGYAMMDQMAEGGDDAVLGGLRQVADGAEGEGLKRALDVLAPRNGVAGYTENGRFMRQYGLGSPVAAYSAVTAGGAMGTAAALQAYDWWLSQQQQEKKDSPLPLQGNGQ